MKGGLQSAIAIASYGAAKVLPAAIMFVAIPLWTRTYGPSQYGLYSIAWGSTLVASSYAVGWLRQSTLRYAGHPEMALERIPRLILAMSILASTLPVTVILSLEGARRHSPVGLLSSVGAIFAITTSLYVIEQTRAQRDNRTASYFVAEVLRIAIAVAATPVIVLITHQAGAISILISFALGTLFALGVLMLKKTPTVASKGSRAIVLRTYWNYGWPLGVWLAISTGFIYADRLIISTMLGQYQAGVYASAADTITRGVGMVFFPLTMFSHTLIMRTWNGGQGAEALRINRQYTRGVVLGSMAVIAIGSLSLPTLLSKIIGVSLDSSLSIPLLLAASCMWQLALMSHKPLEMTGRTTSMILAIFLSAVVSVTFSVTMLPVLGTLATALAFLIGGSLYVAVTSYLSRAARKQILALEQKTNVSTREALL